MTWLSAPIKTVARVVTGNTPPKSDESNYGADIPWVKPPDLGSTIPIMGTSEMLSTKGAEKARVLPAGAILVSCIGTVGRTGIAGTELATNQQINAVVCGPTIFPRFAMYWFMHSAEELAAMANKAVVPILNKGNFEQIRIPVWPLSEQRRIVEILDDADRLRHLRQKADTKTTRILPALFLKMFGDPATNSMGWPSKTFSEAFNDCTGGQEKLQSKEMRASGAIPVIDQGQAQIAGYTDDLTLAFTGMLPVVVFGDHTRIFKFVEHPFVFGADGIRVLSATPIFNPLFAFWHCRMLDIPSAGYSRHFKFLKGKGFVCPDKALQDRFATLAHEATAQISLLEVAASRVDSLFSMLLTMAFSGQLTAKWREGRMKELLAEMEQQARMLNLTAQLETTP